MQRELQRSLLATTGRYIRKLFAEIELRVKTLESRPVPQDGKSVTLDDVRPLIELCVAAQVRQIPVPENGKSVTVEDVRPLVESLVTEKVATIPPAQDGRSVTVDDVRPLIESLVTEQVKALPPPRDGQSITVDDVRPMVEEFLRGIPAPKDGTSVTLEDVRPMVERYLEALPKPKDGDDGKSVTLEEVRGYLDTEIASWELAFERRATSMWLKMLETLPKAKDGKDAIALEAFDLAIEGRTITISMRAGDQVQQRSIRIPAVLDAGVFREGTAYEKGDGVTFGGSFWIAQKDAPEGKPGTSADWRLAVKKGRDGSG